MITKRSKLVPEFNRYVVDNKETFYRFIDNAFIAILFRKELKIAERQIDAELKWAAQSGVKDIKVRLINFPSTAFSHITERVRKQGWDLTGASGGGSTLEYVVTLDIKL